MKLGLLGCGGIAEAHLTAASRLRQAKFVHVADLNPDAAENLAGRYGVTRISSDPACVIDDDEVEAVVIALPTHLHHEWIIRCAQAGKHVLTEKPLCRTMRQARRAIGVCRERGVKLGVGYMRRYNPLRGKIRQLVRSGKLGRPVTWTVASFGPRLDYGRGPGNWMWNVRKGGGLVMDGHIHDFDFATWVLGRPAEIFAQSQCISPEVTAPTQASAVVRFERGDTLLFAASWQEGDFGSGETPHRIVGPKGTIVFDGDAGFRWHYAPGKQRYSRVAWDRYKPPGIGSRWVFRKQLESFIKRIGSDEADSRLVTGEEALESLWIAERIVEAGPKGRTYRWRER